MAGGHGTQPLRERLPGSLLPRLQVQVGLEGGEVFIDPGLPHLLGRAAARDIARAHGGGLTLRNRPEGGLEVALTLPR